MTSVILRTVADLLMTSTLFAECSIFIGAPEKEELAHLVSYYSFFLPLAYRSIHNLTPLRSSDPFQQTASYLHTTSFGTSETYASSFEGWTSPIRTSWQPT
jgi:hypothetical protein